VVARNVSELTDGVKTGRLDAVLLLRSDIRSVLTSVVTPPIPAQSTFRVDYQIAQFRNSAPSDQFSQWLQGSPTARHALRFAGMLSFYDV
jgi:ABC-type molybdate transport system substrate-binding protein